MSLDWMSLKFKITKAHNSFIDDVELAAKAARASCPPNVVQFITTRLIAETLKSFATNVSPEILAALARLGEIDLAVNYVELMNNLELQIRSYRLLASITRERGLPRRANEMETIAASLEQRFTTGFQELRPTSELLSRIHAGDKTAMRWYYGVTTYPNVWPGNILPATPTETLLGIDEAMQLADDEEKAHILGDLIGRMTAEHDTRSLTDLVERLKRDTRYAYRPESLASAAVALATLHDNVTALSVADLLDPKYARDLIMNGVDDETAGYYAMDYGFAIARLEARHRSLRRGVLEAIIADLALRAKRKAIDDAIAASRMVDQLEVTDVWIDVARLLLAHEQGEELPARNALAKTTHVSQRKEELFAGMSAALASVGNTDKSEQVLYQIKDVSLRLNVQGHIITIYLSRNQPELVATAINAVQVSKDERVQMAIANAVFEGSLANTPSDLIESALSLVGSQGEKYARVASQKRAALAFTRSGDLGRAISIAESIMHQGRQGSGQKDRDDDAYSFFLRCKSEATEIHSHVCQVLAASNELDQAIGLIQDMDPESNFESNVDGIAEALGAVAASAAKAGDTQRLDVVLELTQGINNSWNKPVALALVCRAIASRGDLETALANSDDGYNTARSNAAKNHVRAAVAFEQFRRGQFDSAFETLKVISDMDTRARTIKDFAESLTSNTQILLPRLIGAAHGVNDSRFRPAAINGIALASARLLDADGLGAAFEAALGLDQDTEKVEALRGVAHALVASGSFNGLRLLIKTINQIDALWARIDALQEVTNAYASIGNVDAVIGLLIDELDQIKGNGRDVLFYFLSVVSASIAKLDRGKTLWAIYLKLTEVEKWW
ncbi:MAG: hypothetical protein HS126_39980 [Anaerolineales bacterium]|nr:hypothetical protein [Anaerolineales bacterium]